MILTHANFTSGKAKPKKDPQDKVNLNFLANILNTTCGFPII
jgi:hypothetical protein